MPSRRSPSQREKGFRIDRVLGMFGGSHAGRVTNATPSTVTTPSVPAPVEPTTTGGTTITPGGRRTVDVTWPGGHTFTASGSPDSSANGFDSSAAHAATATAFSTDGSQLLLCTDGKAATYHARIETRMYRSSFVGGAPIVGVEFDLGDWFGYTQWASFDFGVPWFSWQGMKHCSPGQAINTFEFGVTISEAAGNGYRWVGDNVALILTRMPA